MGDDSDSSSTRATRPARLALARIRAWWRGATFGTDRPARRVAALGALGLVTGAAEAATVILIVALASGSDAELPLVAGLPDATGALGALALAAVLVLALAHVASALIAARAAVDAERTVQDLLVEAYLAAPWSRQAAARTGELQDLVTVRASLLASGTEEAARALATALNLTVVVAVAVAVSAWAAAALLAVIALAVLVARPFQAYRRRVAFETAEASADLSVEVTETARAARDLRVFGVVSRARNRLRDRVSAVARSMLALRFSAGAVPALTRDLAVAALVGGLALVVSRGDVSLAQLGAAVVLVLRALAHAQELVAIAHGLQDREANLELIRRRLADWAPEGPAGDRPCAEIRRVELRSVSYRYPGGERLAVREANLDLRRGEQVGIVGRTGAGKSTLAAIVLGLLRPDGGEVLVDGTPLSDIERSDWNRRVAWIGQEPHLLTGTVAENIRFLRPELDHRDIARAAEAAGLGREIEEWPLGLDHPVGPEGAALSGGQRQRVALARALAGEPDLLVLDEPTSALDAHAEAAVRETLSRLRGETIVVVIAHRLSTINACDRIAIVDAGRIAALAPPQEVAASEPYFREALELSDLHA